MPHNFDSKGRRRPIKSACAMQRNSTYDERFTENILWVRINKGKSFLIASYLPDKLIQMNLQQIDPLYVPETQSS